MNTILILNVTRQTREAPPERRMFFVNRMVYAGHGQDNKVFITYDEGGGRTTDWYLVNSDIQDNLDALEKLLTQVKKAADLP